MKVRLTQFTIDRAKCKGKGYTMWDQQQKGLGLRVLKFRKTWTVMRSVQRERITLGHYPEMGLKEAREAAYALRRGKRSVLTYGEAGEKFLSHCEVHNRIQTVYARRRVIRTVFASFNGRNLGELRHRDVMEAIEGMTPSAQRAAFSIWLGVFQLLRRAGGSENSPLEGKKPPRPLASRERVLTDDELKAIVRTAHTDLRNDYKRMVYLLAFTGQRRGQFAKYKREWLGEHTITFPKEVMKGKKVTTIPYPVYVTEELFYDIHVTQFTHLKTLFDEECGLTGAGYTLHDVRRTWRTNVSRLSGIAPSSSSRRCVGSLQLRRPRGVVAQQRHRMKEVITEFSTAA